MTLKDFFKADINCQYAIYDCPKPDMTHHTTPAVCTSENVETLDALLDKQIKYITVVGQKLIIEIE